MTARFSILPTLDGFDVIDDATGRPVDHRDTARSANGVAFSLNDAARHGQLSRRLGCHPSDPSDPDSIRRAFRDPIGTESSRGELY